MRKLIIAGSALLLVACAGVTLDSVIGLIVTNAKNLCGVAVSASDLQLALEGSNVDALSKTVNLIAHSICDQYKAQVTTAAATGEFKAGTAGACYKVNVNGKAVEACR